MVKNIFESKISDLIHIEKNFLSKKLCEKIINEYDDQDIQREVRDHMPDRKLSRTYVSSREVINRKNSYERKKIDIELVEVLRSSLKIYIQNVWKDFTFNQDQGFCLNKMIKGDGYNEHVDNVPGTSCDWKMTLVYLLNDDFQGGDFTVHKVDQKLQQGDLIMFPSYWMFPHGIKTVTKGSRYSLITWAW